MNEALNHDDFEPKSIAIYEDFLTYYSSKNYNQATYKNAYKAILRCIDKTDITKWEYEDFQLAIEKKVSSNTNQIFSFLYAKGYLENEIGFKNKFNSKENILKNLNKKKESLKGSNEPQTNMEYNLAISVPDLEKIFSFIKNVDLKNYKNIKATFFFYLLFDLDLPPNQIQAMKGANYKDGSYTFEAGYSIEIPERFNFIFETANKREVHSGLGSPNEDIAYLGLQVGIKGLEPNHINTAKNQRTMLCPECGYGFLATIENWVSINGFLVCKDCAERLWGKQDLKKNEMINNIPNYWVEFEENNILVENDDLYNILIDLGNIEVTEGSQNLITHLIRERRPQIVKLAKKKFIKEHGKLYCVLCEFDFKEKYGNLGENFIQAHHINPISEMKEEDKTKVNDLIMVCSNCHSMLHNRNPWKTVEELQKILEINKSLN